MVDNSVKGKTAVYGVIGCPIEHTFSPAIHNTMAKTLNKDMIYEAFRVEKDNLESAIKGAYSLGIKGLNVQMERLNEMTFGSDHGMITSLYSEIGRASCRERV